MDYEKNNEALDIVKRMVADGQVSQEVAEKYFPELKENEDKRIRKELIAFLKENLETGRADETWSMSGLERWIAWLEKQGEKNPVAIPKFRVGDFVKDANYHGEPTYEIVGMDGECYICQYRGNKSMGDRSVMHFCFDNPYLRLVEQKPVDIVAILKDYFANTPKEQQDKDWEELKHLNNFGWELIEQRSTDKVEPKFKQGEWIIFNGLILYVNEVVQGYYRTISIDGIPNSYDWDIDNAARLWTIQEAKAGDVLASKDGGDILIFRNIEDNLSFSSYYNIEGKNEHYWAKSCFIPATKEQRDLLFQKMHEAGYEWDAEKKEPKEIEQKPALGEEDEDMLYKATAIINRLCAEGKEYVWSVSTLKKLFYWLKDLKERVQPQPKPAWSEEDEKHIHSIISTIECCRKENEQSKVIADCYTSDLEWFKSLMNRCKPSEDLPHWKKGTLKGKNVTGFNSDFFSHNGYYINYKELFDKLPKDE